eukprot:TRINITY_DN7492_c0_g1_i1.p1 TRINITY_DN7492_c0_g1~~TRINITY_DN7492_c0_g1_i1.p1  ORF type:complete len:758 (-),score=244.33 TRINITY_DN7492_c0_g1_i1:87-2360(-)
MKVFLIVFLGLVLASAIQKPWMNVKLTPEERARALLAQMTLEEKILEVHGTVLTSPYCGCVSANKRLGIPELHMEDGPQGVADGVKFTTGWPSALTVISSWDDELMYKWGQAIAEEQHAKGVHITLGPMFNLARVPSGGRNFESFGEDPLLAGRMAASQIKGIQAAGNVMACAKHYVDNNQEWERGTVSEEVPERAQYELYYPAFRASVDAGALSVMCSYNKINGTWACENPNTLGKVLKGEMDYKYFVMSDWGGTHTAQESMMAGLDMEMPGFTYYGSTLQKLVESGKVPLAKLDDAVFRILNAMFTIGMFDHPTTGDLTTDTRSPSHNKLAFQLATAGTVLLKNQNNLLPLDASKLKTIAVIGDDANDKMFATGGGSGNVVLPYIIPPLTGVQSRAGYTRLQNCTYEKDIDYYQTGSPVFYTLSTEECSSLCLNDFNCRYFTYQASSHSCWLKATNAGRKTSAGLVSGGCAPATAGGVTVTYTNSKDVNAAKKAAQAADIAIVFAGVHSGEGSDRANLDLSDNALISGVASVQGRTIVVAHNPGAVLMPWIDSVSAVVAAFYPGQENGNAIAAILFGDVNPSGRLPLSFPKTATDTWLTSLKQYPGEWGKAHYTEDLEMGYRWYNAKRVEPLFLFGYGLSYTSFDYSALDIVVSGHNEVTATCTLKNTGARDGAEVAEVFIDYPSVAGEPPKQLKAYKKLFLKAGESTTLTFKLGENDLSYWDIASHSFVVPSGAFKLYIGSTLNHIALYGNFAL